MFRAGYGHFLRTAASLQWNEAAIELRGDAAAWRTVGGDDRGRILRLLAGFVVGERSVAAQLDPFAAAAEDPDVAACFEAQTVDEGRHARFFERALDEVCGVIPGNEVLGGLVEPELGGMFERRLPATARALAAGEEELDAAVALYHLLLEGIVFTAGQLAMLELLVGRAELPGLRRGIELVLRDERWHIGFGTTCLARAPAREETLATLAADVEGAVGAWGDAVSERTARHVLDLHRRRLGAAGLARAAYSAA